MTPLDRSKREVQPYNLALATQRVTYRPYNPGLHGLGGLGSLWDDILQAGGNWLDNKLQQSGISGTDIVAIQNQVGATMDSIASQYYQLRDTHQVTAQIISNFQQAFQTLINSFCAKANAIGTTRARDGCATIQYWGGRWITDRETEKQQLSSGGTVVGGCTTVDPVTGQCLVFSNLPPGGAVGTITSYLPVVLGAAFVYIMAKSSKKW